MLGQIQHTILTLLTHIADVAIATFLGLIVKLLSDFKKVYDQKVKDEE